VVGGAVSDPGTMVDDRPEMEEACMELIPGFTEAKPQKLEE